jgi:hypothetical protein
MGTSVGVGGGVGLGVGVGVEVGAGVLRSGSGSFTGGALHAASRALRPEKTSNSDIKRRLAIMGRIIPAFRVVVK